MATSVQVLCPNGRRQNVKVTPNTKLMQILEEVCTKQSLLPSDDFDLVHGRKTVDLTLAVRFSNLPNNARLELVKSTTSRSQTQGDVTIALQLENGERLQHTFEPPTSLWQILEYWESQNEKQKGKLAVVDTTQSPPVHPVCIYMRDEVIGEPALKFTTLKKLALTAGKAIIRLIHRPVDDSTLAEVVQKIEQEKAKQARLQRQAKQSESAASNHSTSVDRTANSSRMEVRMEEEDATVEKMSGSEGGKATAPPKVEPMDTQDGTSQAPRSRDPTQGETSSPVSGSEVAKRGSSAEGPAGYSAIEELRRMNVPGIEVITPQDFHHLSAEQQQVARRLVRELLPGGVGPGAVGGQPGASAKKPKTAPPRPAFVDFKFPEATKGKDLYQNEMSDVKAEEYKPCEREAIIYNSNEENTSKAMVQDVPDEFFDVTDVDVKSLYKDLQQKAASDRPLMTETMRLAEIEERHQQYDFIVMRVQFPDGLVLQGCFRPRETVFSLYKFVKEHLEDKGQEFTLYKSPPKMVLTDTAKTLVQAELAPATLVYFGSDKKEEHCLLASARNEIAPKRRADELSVKKLARKQMESLVAEGTSSLSTLPTFPRSGSQGVSDRDGPGRFRPSSASGTRSNADADPKLPKWLKLGKK